MDRRVNNWGRWGAQDEIGSLNLIDKKKVLEAVSLVKEGTVISLAQPMGPNHPSPPHRRKLARFMDRDAGDYALGARSVGGFRFAEDTVIFPTHSGTHIDALSHTWRDEHLYNGFSQSNIRSTKGAAKLGIDKIGPILTRGVLLDFVKIFGKRLNPSTAITATDLEKAYISAGIEPKSGDAVLIRTGWWESMGGSDKYFDLEPGISDKGAKWLAALDVSIVGSDNYAIEVQPDPEGNPFPVHLTLIHQFGIPLVENLDLSKLAQKEVNSFLFVLAPLPLEGSTASPLTPIAVI